MEPFITLDKVYFTYDSSPAGNFILSDFSLDIYKGEFLSVVGRNGSGKSTLSKLLNSLYLPTSGEIIVDGINTKEDSRLLEIRKKVGLVLQDPDNQMVSSIVEDDTAFGCENLGLSPEMIRQRVDDSLRAVGMYEERNTLVEKLSGGQKQRAAIAGIIAMQPECIVLDEPTAMLDPQGRKEVMDTLIKLNKNLGITVILITHYMEEAALSDRIAVLDEGKVIITGKPRDVFSNADLLYRHRLSLPQVTELSHRLSGCGYDMPYAVLSVDECADAIIRLFSKGDLL